MIVKNRFAEIVDMYFLAQENSNMQLTEPQRAHLDRLRDAYTHWLSNPILPDNRIRDYLMMHYGINKTTAYQDIAIIKAIFGHVPAANKEQMRLKANHLYDMAAAAAIAGNESKARALTKVADGIVKNNRLDDKEEEQYKWEDVVPADFSLSVDPAVIGIAPVPDIQKKAAKLLKQYYAEIDGPVKGEVDDGR